MFVRCFLLLIPVVGNVMISIHDCTKKKVYNNPVIYPKKNGDLPKIVGVPISIKDVEKIEVSLGCLQSYPCQHETTVTLRDGRKAYVWDNEDIFSIVSKLPDDKINPGSECTASEIRDHFKPKAGSVQEDKGDEVNVDFQDTE